LISCTSGREGCRCAADLNISRDLVRGFKFLFSLPKADFPDANHVWFSKGLSFAWCLVEQILTCGMMMLMALPLAERRN